MPRAMEPAERDASMQEGLRRNNARFVASMNRILERYNHPFEDDLLISMDTLTYDTPNGPKQWGQVSRRDIKKWKKTIFKHNRRSRENTEISKQESSDFEDEHSTVHQDSSENSAVDTSDIGEESGDVVSVRRKFDDFHLQNLNVDDGQILKKERVSVDLIEQDDARKIPRSIQNPNVGDGQILKKERVPVDLIVQDDERKIPKWIWNPNVGDGQILKKERVPVDLIVQDDERKIPKWIWITSPSSSKDHRVTLPVQELFGNQAAVCRKKLELSNECSSSRYLQLQHSGLPISLNPTTSPRHRPCPERSRTLCDSIHEEYQSADEECSWSNTTLGDLYPAMVEIFTRLMTKQFQRKVLKYMFRQLWSRRRHSRRPKLNVTVDNVRGLGPCKLKKAFHSMCSHRSEDNQNPSSGNESREFCYDDCLSNSSGLVPYAYTDTNENKMDYSDSSLQQHLASEKGQNVYKHTAFPDVTERMGETFLVEDEVQTAASPENSDYTEGEKLSYKRFSEGGFRTSTASSDSRALHLVQESNAQKAGFSCVGGSELCSSACSSHGNSDNSVAITNCSPARSSNIMFIYPEKIISERQTSFQHKDSFSPWFMKQSPSKMPDKYEDAFEELYYKVCSEEFQKSLTLTRPLLNSQDLEKKGRLVRSHSSDFVRSTKQCDRIYEQLPRESVPKFPGFRTASNFRKYKEIQMPATVNALVNSPVRTYSAISRVKRIGNFQNYLPCSPLKRLKLTPERCFSSRQCQETSHRKMVNHQRAGMDFLSTYNCSNPSFFADHNCHYQDSGSHDSSDKTFLVIPGTSLQEFGTAGAHSGWPGAVENCSSPRNVRQHHSRVYRKLSYADGKDQL